MVDEPNVDTIKKAIVAILKTNTSKLWQEDNHEIGFQVIEVGLPENARFEGLTYPVCYVTNDTNLEDDRPYGPVSANSMGASEHIFRFRIIFFEHKEDGQTTEKALDDLQEAIKDTLKANVNLNSNVTSSFPKITRSFAAELNGRPLDGRIILLECRVHSN